MEANTYTTADLEAIGHPEQISISSDEEQLLHAHVLADVDPAAAQGSRIERNLKLVVYFVRRYEPLAANVGIALDELINYGYSGLLRADSRYNADEGVTFSRYAADWIRHSIVAGIPCVIPGVSYD